jgi:thioester reductase-like protein
MDGTIEYLGRNDHQVKFRGLRIELGEIEAQLARHEDIKETVVLVREDIPGEKRLVAYVEPRVSRAAPKAESLRAHLSGVLPEYMVPSVFVMLERFPLTRNRKLDRKALPAPELGADSSLSYTAPGTDIEQALVEIWQTLFSITSVGVDDDFFRLGGHSLLALKMMSSIRAALSVELPIKALFELPTVRQLAGRVAALRRVVVVNNGAGADLSEIAMPTIDSAVMEDPLIDLSQESALDLQIAASVPVHAVPGTILLTGATGFVGRFLLAELLEQTDAAVYCLLRASSQQEASMRLKTTLLKWDLWREEWAQRVIAVAGDLCQPRVGLDESTYEMLALTIGTIYHCGASVNHLETYARAKAANVGAASELLRFAIHSRLKLVNYISTSSVFSEMAGDRPRVVYEHSSIDQEQHRNSQGYAASKWVGEKIFLTAGERGIACNVFRLGLIWADSLQGRYDERQYGYRLIKSCLSAGCGISGYSFEMPLTPVDYAARAVAFLAARHPEGAGIFHISASSQMRDVFERCNEILDVPLRLVPNYDWVQIVKRLHEAGHSLPIVPLVEFAFSMDAGSFQEHERRSQSGRVRFDCTRTQHELEQAGIVTQAANEDLLRGCLQCMQAPLAASREHNHRRHWHAF